MAVGSHNSNEVVVSTGARWTGVANMLVISINPTMEELKQMGLNPQKEPSYITDEIGEALGAREGGAFKKHRLDINLYHPEKKFYAKAAFWLENRVRYNKNGDKVEWINKFGQATWSPSETEPPSYSWFKQDMARPALVGESVLTSFIKNWANCNPNDQAILDNPKALAEGDLTELKALFKNIARNEVQVLVGVNEVAKDGKTNYYQAVYTGYFDRPYSKNIAAWRNALNGEYGKFDANYQNDLTLKVFDGGKTIEQDKPSNLNQEAFSGQTATTSSSGPGFEF